MRLISTKFLICLILLFKRAQAFVPFSNHRHHGSFKLKLLSRVVTQQQHIRKSLTAVPSIISISNGHSRNVLCMPSMISNVPHNFRTDISLNVQNKNLDEEKQENAYSSHDTPTNISIRKELGKLTGISLTAIRASIRATTGLSLTALRTTLRTLTGVSMTGVVKTLLGLLPPWFRYFLQPFLIMYYVPLLVLRGLIGSSSTSKKEANEEHQRLVNYWKEAIQMAETRCDSWPLHVKADGTLQYDLDDDRMSDVIVEAIEMKHLDEKK